MQQRSPLQQRSSSRGDILSRGKESNRNRGKKKRGRERIKETRRGRRPSEKRPFQVSRFFQTRFLSRFFKRFFSPFPCAGSRIKEKRGFCTLGIHRFFFQEPGFLVKGFLLKLLAHDSSRSSSSSSLSRNIAGCCVLFFFFLDLGARKMRRAKKNYENHHIVICCCTVSFNFCFRY